MRKMGSHRECTRVCAAALTVESHTQRVLRPGGETEGLKRKIGHLFEALLGELTLLLLHDLLVGALPCRTPV
jgi:hypothetical protein